jgi:hypothetical protein
MIDKARAYFAGTHGDYLPYPCPGDKRFLGFFGLDATALGELIKSGADDAAIGAYVAAHAQGDRAAYRRTLEDPPTGFMALVFRVFRWRSAAAIRAKDPTIDISQLTTFGALIAAEEGHPIPGR